MLEKLKYLGRAHFTAAYTKKNKKKLKNKTLLARNRMLWLAECQRSLSTVLGCTTNGHTLSEKLSESGTLGLNLDNDNT